MRGAAVLAAGVAAAGPLAAYCPPDRFSAAERAEFGFRPPADWFDRTADRVAPGWVFYQTQERPRSGDDRDALRLVLEHCATRQRLIAWVGPQGLDRAAYATRYEGLAFGIFHHASAATAQTYTLADIATWVRVRGDGVRLDRAAYVSCACAGLAPQAEGE